MLIFVYCQKQQSSNRDSLTGRSQVKIFKQKTKIDNLVT